MPLGCRWLQAVMGGCRWLWAVVGELLLESSETVQRNLQALADLFQVGGLFDVWGPGEVMGGCGWLWAVVGLVCSSFRPASGRFSAYCIVSGG